MSSGIPLNHRLYLAQAAAPDYGITENTDYLQFTNPEDGQNLNPAPGTNAIPTDPQQFNLDYGANTNPDDALELNPGNGLETTQVEGQNINPNIWDETAITGNQAEKTNPPVKTRMNNPVKPAAKNPAKTDAKTTVENTPKKDKKKK